MKSEFIRNTFGPVNMRTAFETYYINKFFNKWMKKFNVDGLDYQEKYYIFKKFWYDGTIACSKRLNPSAVEDMFSKVVFTPWVMATTYNCYDFPTHARAINVRGVSYIDGETAFELDKDIVIGWCQANHKGIYSLIAPKLKQLVDLEMVIRICTKNQKAPWILATSPEDKKAVEQLKDDLDSDKEFILTMLNDLKNAKSLISGAPFVVDKLEAQRQKVEDDIKTLLGIQNVGIAQKKEHFTDDEVQTNNSEIDETSEEYLDEIQDFFDRCNNCFGTSISVSLSYQFKEDYNEDEEYQEDESNE